MKKTMTALLLAVMFSASAREVTISIKNPLPAQRVELAEVDLDELTKRMELPAGATFIIKNGLDQKLDYQITHDRKVLFDVAVSPGSTLSLKAMAGEPDTPKTFVTGKQYPERKDDIAWENDRTGYRVYGPKFQRDGDVGYGIDVWCKNTPTPILDQFYKDRSRLSFHKNHGFGMDCYNVWASLGCGTPALLKENGEYLYPYCYENYEILDNGPLRFTMRLDFAPVSYRGGSVTEHRIISLDKFSNFCKMTVWYDGLTDKAPAVAGLVLHTPTSEGVEIGKQYALYADPTGDAKAHNFQIFVGLLFPEGVDRIERRMEKNPQKDVYGHLLGHKKQLGAGEPFTYYFGSAWSHNDVRTFDEWKLRANQQLKNMKSPLIVTLD